MTDRQFLKRMIFLTEKMGDIYSVEPLDQEARQAVLDEVRDTGEKFNRDHRRRSWIASFAAFSAILFVLYLVYLLLSEL